MNDYVKVYRERFWSLWTGLKKIFRIQSSCNGDCNQGRNCNCGPEKKSGKSKSRRKPQKIKN